MSFVLIVETDEFVFQKVNDLLATGECEFEYQIVSTPDKALDILKERTVDVLVSEINMPIMSGSELFALVNMMSPDTVHVAITNANKVTETVAFMNECKVRKLIISPFHMVEDVVEPILAALEYKNLKDRIKAEEKEFDESISNINDDYDRMENDYMKNSEKYDNVVEVITNLLKTNIDSAGEKVTNKEKLISWYQMVINT